MSFLRGVARFWASWGEGREVDPCPRYLLFMCKNFYCIIQRISYNKNNGAPFGVHRCFAVDYSIHFACKLINLLKIFIYCCAEGYVPVCF